MKLKPMTSSLYVKLPRQILRREHSRLKNSHTLKFRGLFVAVSVISVASLLKAAATLVLASAMMMVRSDALTYDKWKLYVINL